MMAPPTPPVDQPDASDTQPPRYGDPHTQPEPTDKQGSGEELPDEQPDQQVQTPSGFLDRAVIAVPAVKYALGVGGVASVVVIVFGFLSVANPKYRLDPNYLVIGVALAFVGMFLMLIFSSAASKPGARWILAPAIVLTYFVTLAVIVGVSGLMINYFVPGKIAQVFGPRKIAADAAVVQPALKATAAGSRTQEQPLPPKPRPPALEGLPDPSLTLAQFEAKYIARSVNQAQRSQLNFLAQDIAHNPTPLGKHDAYAISRRGDIKARWWSNSLDNAERTAVTDCMKSVLAEPEYMQPNPCRLVVVDDVHKGGW